jgi:hypothetical protein
MFKIKTPHGFAGRHTFNTVAIFAAAAFLALALTWGTTHSIASWAGVLATSVITGVVGVFGGVAITGGMRSLFNWFQTGRFIQWLAFAATLWVGFWLSTLIVPYVAITNYLALTAITVVAGFGVGIISGVIPTRGRTWLPMRAGNKFRGH